jgi:hypothetical protein
MGGGINIVFGPKHRPLPPSHKCFIAVAIGYAIGSITLLIHSIHSYRYDKVLQWNFLNQETTYF